MRLAPALNPMDDFSDLFLWPKARQIVFAYPIRGSEVYRIPASPSDFWSYWVEDVALRVPAKISRRRWIARPNILSDLRDKTDRGEPVQGIADLPNAEFKIQMFLQMSN
jgi:hypothetical protein